jgi:hypothetical protein
MRVRLAAPNSPRTAKRPILFYTSLILPIQKFQVIWLPLIDKIQDNTPALYDATTVTYKNLLTVDAVSE